MFYDNFVVLHLMTFMGDDVVHCISLYVHVVEVFMHMLLSGLLKIVPPIYS